jgi:hypothetical protein
MFSISARLTMGGAATLLALGLAACGGSTTTPDAAATPSTATPLTSSSAGTDSATGSAAASAVTKVSANTASEDEIAAALESAGVSNPERWAVEVVEYRPYPTDDPDLTKLRDNLAKYNPGQETTDKIVSALAP